VTRNLLTVCDVAARLQKKPAAVRALANRATPTLPPERQQSKAVKDHFR
jgi:hypothetical protein